MTDFLKSIIDKTPTAESFAAENESIQAGLDVLENETLKEVVTRAFLNIHHSGPRFLKTLLGEVTHIRRNRDGTPLTDQIERFWVTSAHAHMRWKAIHGLDTQMSQLEQMKANFGQYLRQAFVLSASMSVYQETSSGEYIPPDPIKLEEFYNKGLANSRRGRRNPAFIAFFSDWRRRILQLNLVDRSIQKNLYYGFYELARQLDRALLDDGFLDQQVVINSLSDQDLDKRASEVQWGQIKLVYLRKLPGGKFQFARLRFNASLFFALKAFMDARQALADVQTQSKSEGDSHDGTQTSPE